MSARPVARRERLPRLESARAQLEPRPPWPPPPHDPRERELVMTVAGWDVRLFAGRHMEYFVTRGFWHIQLWHPRGRVSVLTPSRLTSGFYEAFTTAGWKVQAPAYGQLVALITGVPAVRLPPSLSLLRLERALVHDVVCARGQSAS